MAESFDFNIILSKLLTRMTVGHFFLFYGVHSVSTSPGKVDIHKNKLDSRMCIPVETGNTSIMK